MKGDFSRQTFQQQKHYTTVLKQQGRVATDADWNEQEAIHAYYRKREGSDIIGRTGAPLASPGFGIWLSEGEIFISAGRYYVDGILCENEGLNGRAIAYSQQPNLPSPDALEDIMANAPEPLLLLYLDVWQRHITALDDPAIREKALGGPDTATRLKTIWQVKGVAVTFDAQPLLTILKDASDQLTTQLAPFANNQDVVGKIQPIIDRIAQVLQSDVPDTYPALRRLAIDFDDILAHIIELPTAFVGISTLYDATQRLAITMKAHYVQFVQGLLDQPFPTWQAVQQPSSGQLSACTQPTPATDTPCQLPPSAGYQSLENQLYRIEILQGGDTATDTITYLWSRDNGTVVTTIASTDPLKIGDRVVFVDDVGPDDDLGFAHTQLVEVSDDRLELHGLPGQLTTIADINRATHSVTLADPLSTAIDVTLHAKLRRWDGTGSMTIPAGGQETDWLALENNIQVKFAAGTYKTGDYWLVPARSIDGTIEWPVVPQKGGTPIAQPLPPLGIQHHYAPLALLYWQDIQDERPINRETLRPLFALPLIPSLRNRPVEIVGAGTVSTVTFVRDYRTFFQSLTDERSALHVLGTNWTNDSILSISQINQLIEQDGLIIYLDDAPDPLSLIDGVSMIVSVEIAETNLSAVQYNSVTILAGVVDAIDNALRWRLSLARQAAIQRTFSPRAAVLPLSLARVRVQLKGSLIWQAGRSQFPTHRVAPFNWHYLDGQSLAEPGGTLTLPDGTTRTQIQLLFPSGTGNQASDFESWLWVNMAN